MGKKKLKEDKEFNKIKHLLQKESPERFIALFKRDYSLDSISKYFNRIMDFPKLKNVKLNNLLIDNVNIFYKNEIGYNSKNIWFELSWVLLMINRYKDILQEFSIMKLEFENNILLGEFDKALSLLKKIEKIYGNSLWLIRNKIILLQEIEGIEAQKKYVNILMEKDTSVIFKTLVYFFSISAEENISAIYFSKRIEDFFLEYKDPILTNYFMFKLNKTSYIKPEYFIDIFEQEKTTSIIDIYETFIDIIARVLLFRVKENGEKETFIKLLKKLNKSIHDSRLVNIQRTLGIKKQLTVEEKNKDIIEIYESFLIGNNKNVVRLSKNILNKKPIYMSLYKIFLESLSFENIAIPLENNSLINKILSAYQNILLMNSNTDESIEFLFKVVVTYPHLSISNYIFSFLYEYIQDNHYSISDIASFDNGIFSEEKYEIYPDNIKIDFLEKFQKINNTSIFIKLLFNFDIKSDEFLNIINEDSIVEDNKNSFRMYYYFYHEKYDDSKQFASKLLLSKNEISKNEAKKIILKILLKKDE